MPRNLPHLAGLIFNTPLMVWERKLDTVLSALGPRILDGLDMSEAAEANEAREARATRDAQVGGVQRLAGGGYMAGDGIAVLPVVGSLVRRADFLDAASGLTSYDSLRNSVTEILMSPNVRGLMLEMDTPGGEASGVFDCADFIRQAAETTGKPIWAHANELAASAGYALASSAARIWIARTGEVGSIGVVAAHVDVSEADKAAGRKWTLIHAGEEKVDGNPHEPLSKRARGTVQSDIDKLMTMFVDLVARNRRMSGSAVRRTSAKMYRGKKAVTAKLADEVGTLHEALDAFARHLDAADGVPVQEDLEPGASGAVETAAADRDSRVRAARARGLARAGREPRLNHH